ncbi:MAG: pilin [Candidatus Accumulibacter sp.]|nr:pilin [Accumulibacter sp.]
MGLAGAAQTGVVEYYADMGKWPTTNTEAGLVSKSKIKGNAVTSVEVGTAGKITITFNEKVENGKVVVLEPSANDGSYEWACNSAAGTNVNAKYLPSRCR